MEQYKPVHIPCTLKGPGNYITWSRMARMALGSRGLWEHVTSGSVPKKITQGEDDKEVVVADEGKWVHEDLMMVLLWILTHTVPPQNSCGILCTRCMATLQISPESLK